MPLDIKTGVQTALLITLILAALSLLLGFRSIRAGNQLPFFRKRRERVVHGWRMIFVGVGFGTVWVLVNSFAEPVAYRYFPPSPTVTLTSTITITPTISVTPSITMSPTITNTPSVTNTPSIPEAVATQFEAVVTPAGKPVFSGLRFAKKLNENFQPVDPANEFANPLNKIYGVFSYDQMTPGAQWTALWLRNGQQVFFETLPWNGGTGGYGYTEWEPNSEEWLPGVYDVHIFVGMEWIQEASGQFVVTGNPSTSTPTLAPSATQTNTATIGPSLTPTPRPTWTPTFTPTITRTRTRTITPTITLTPTITRTPTITLTPTITRTPRPTDTRWPTLTLPPSATPRP